MDNRGCGPAAWMHLYRSTQSTLWNIGLSTFAPAPKTVKRGMFPPLAKISSLRRGFRLPLRRL
jgi:hypothetical protein